MKPNPNTSTGGSAKYFSDNPGETLSSKKNSFDNLNSCNCRGHSNPKCECNTSDDERAELLREYLDPIESVAPDVRLMPISGSTKRPIIEQKGYKLDGPRAKDLLHTPTEAVEAIREGHPGFAIYAEKESHGTENIVFTDHDNPNLWHPDELPSTLRVMSGSGEGYHTTNLTDGTVERAKGKDALAGAGEVRAHNWIVVTPGSIHSTGGIYHIVDNPGIATLSSDDLPTEMLPRSAGGGSSKTIERVELDSLPDGYNANEETNQWGHTLGEIRAVSSKLNGILTTFNPDPSTYPSASEGDLATVSMLLYWGFEDDQIHNILRDCRGRHKLERDKYVHDTVVSASHTEIRPLDHNLGKALVEATVDRDGGCPTSDDSIMFVRSAFRGMGDELTTKDIVDSNVLDWTDANRESQMRRVRRTLNVLDAAGYVDWRRDGRKTVWIADGICELESVEVSNNGL